MKDLLRTVVGLIIGAIFGAIVGAVMLAVPTYFDTRCGLLGCGRDWTPIAVFLGSIYGGIPGGVIGAIIGIASANRLKSTVIGAITGLIIAIVLFGMGAFGDPIVSLWAILSIPAGALVGVVVGELLRLLRLSRQSAVSVRSAIDQGSL